MLIPKSRTEEAARQVIESEGEKRLARQDALACCLVVVIIVLVVSNKLR